MPLTDEQMEEKYAKEVDMANSSGFTMLTDLFSVNEDKYATAMLAHYIVWLGANAETVSPERLAILALACIMRGTWWGEVAEDLGLPMPAEWKE